MPLAWETAACNARGSSSKSKSSCFTLSPSLNPTLSSWPSRRALIVTVEYALTLPMAWSSTGTSCCVAVATMTGAGGGSVVVLPLLREQPAAIPKAATHPRLVRLRHVMGCFPTASKGFVQCDKINGNRPLAFGKLVLDLVERPLGVEDVKKLRHAFGVPLIGQLERAAVSHDRLGQRAVAHLFVGVGDQRVLDVLERYEHSL